MTHVVNHVGPTMPASASVRGCVRLGELVDLIAVESDAALSAASRASYRQMDATCASRTVGSLHHFSRGYALSIRETARARLRDSLYRRGREHLPT